MKEDSSVALHHLYKEEILILTFGDRMRKMILLVAALCFVALCFNGCAQTNVTTQAPEKITSTDKFLIQDSGTNISMMNKTLYSPIIPFGFNGLKIAQAVKFTPPKTGWNLSGIVVFGSDGWNSSNPETPIQGIYSLEIRDANRSLLYKTADTQLAYFTSPTGLAQAFIEIPTIVTNGDFYVCFYGYDIVQTLAEIENASGNSYYYLRDSGEFLPGIIPVPGTNATIPVNWLIRAVGE